MGEGPAGDGGGATIFYEPCVFCSSVFSVRKRNVLREKKKCPLWEKDLSSMKERIVLCEGINTNRKDRDCQDISAATLLSFRGHAPLH